MRARLSAWWPWRANHQHNPPMVERRRVIGTQKNQPPQGLACLRFCKESHTAKKAVAEPATAAASRLAPMGAKLGESGIVLHHSLVGYLLAPRYREPTRLPRWRRSESHRAKQAILSLSSWVSSFCLLRYPHESRGELRSAFRAHFQRILHDLAGLRQGQNRQLTELASTDFAVVRAAHSTGMVDSTVPLPSGPRSER
jgi:hypothetical protein